MNSGKLKVFYLNKKVIFPQCSLNFVVNKSEASVSIENGDKIIAYPVGNYLDMLFFKKGKTAVISEVISVEEKNERIKLNLKGDARVGIKKFFDAGLAEYYLLEETGSAEAGEQIHELRKTAQELIFLINVSESDRLISLLNFLADPGQMTDFIANYFVVDFKKRYQLLKETDQHKRVMVLIKIMKKIIKNMGKNV